MKKPRALAITTNEKFWQQLEALKKKFYAVPVSVIMRDALSHYYATIIKKGGK